MDEDEYLKFDEEYGGACQRQTRAKWQPTKEDWSIYKTGNMITAQKVWGCKPLTALARLGRMHQIKKQNTYTPIK